MVRFVNCLICGSGLSNDPIITNTCLLKKYWNIFWGEFPDVIIENAVVDGEIPEKDGNLLLKSIKYGLSKFKWLDDVIVVHPNKIIKVKALDGTEFVDIHNNKYNGNYIGGDEVKAYIMHYSCYKLLKKNNYNVSYDSFSNVDNIKLAPRTKRVQSQNIYFNKFKMNYGITNKYIGEYNKLDNYRAYLKDRYLLENPLKNKENANRILKLKFPLKKIKNGKKRTSVKKGRKGPNDSATLYKLGHKKRGNDGNMWIIVENKNKIKRWKLI